MKSKNSESINFKKLKIWYENTDYLLKKFEEVFDALSMEIVEINNDYVKFVSANHIIKFQYDSDQYSYLKGLTLVDIIVIRNSNPRRLSELVVEKPGSPSLNDLIVTGSKKYKPPLDTYKDLFVAYFYEDIKNNTT